MDNQKPAPRGYVIVGHQIFPLDKGKVKVGRHLSNDVVVQDLNVSRYHAEFVQDQSGRFTVIDQNSTGGTFVNGQRVSQSPLYPGDIIHLAKTKVKFILESPKIVQRVKDITGPLRFEFEEPTTQVLPRKKE